MISTRAEALEHWHRGQARKVSRELETAGIVEHDVIVGALLMRGVTLQDAETQAAQLGSYYEFRRLHGGS